MPPVMFSVVTKYHKGRHSLFLYNLEIFCAFTQDILRSQNTFFLFSSVVITIINEGILFFYNLKRRLTIFRGQSPLFWLVLSQPHATTLKLCHFLIWFWCKFSSLN